MMTEAYAPTVNPNLPPVDEFDVLMVANQIEDQVAFLEQRETHATPIEAHYVGHNAMTNTVEFGAEAAGKPAEARAGEAAAEIYRSFSPFNAENTPMYGSEAERLAAVESVRGIANQARMTNKYLNGKHKHLGRELAAGRITQDEHDAQVGEIAAVMALTKPEQLRQVGEAQRASLERRKKSGQISPDVQFVDVTSRRTENGVELAGIDAVVAKMTGARSQAELAANGMSLKREFYNDPEALKKAVARHEAHQANLNVRSIEAEQAQIRRTVELLDEDAKEQRAKYGLAA